MSSIKRFLLSLAALLLFSGVALSAPAAAHASTSGSSDDSTTTESVDSHTTDLVSDNHVSEQTQELANQFKEQAKEKVQTAKQNAKEQTQAHRQQSCEARKANLTKRMSNAVAQSEKHKAVFDKIYTRVKDFHDTKQLNVADYAALTAKVDTAQTNAQNSIDALKALDVNVDCTSQTVADSVSAFQQAVKSTRDSLKAYRSSITDLIKSLKGASTGAGSNSTDNSTNDSTNNTGQ